MADLGAEVDVWQVASERSLGRWRVTSDNLHNSTSTLSSALWRASLFSSCIFNVLTSLNALSIAMHLAFAPTTLNSAYWSASLRMAGWMSAVLLLVWLSELELVGSFKCRNGCNGSNSLSGPFFCCWFGWWLAGFLGVASAAPPACLPPDGPAPPWDEAVELFRGVVPGWDAPAFAAMASALRASLAALTAFLSGFGPLAGVPVVGKGASAVVGEGSREADGLGLGDDMVGGRV